MKRSVLLWSILLFFTHISVAQYFQARFVTSGLSWQRQDTVGSSSTHFFGSQTVQLSLAQKTYSFHTYAQVFNDFAGPVKNDPQYRLYNFYFTVPNIADLVDLNVGRTMVFAGVGNGIIDGATAAAKFYDSRVKVLAYFGFLPPPGQKAELRGNLGYNYMTGAQVLGVPLENTQVSVSYVNKNLKPDAYYALRRDSLFQPYQIEIRPSSSAEQYLSGDVNIDYNESVSGYARYDYDLNFLKTSRFQIFSRVAVASDVALTGEFFYREPRLSYNSIFSVFTYNTTKEFEGGVEYSMTKLCRLFAKYGTVSYGDDNSSRITVGANGKFLSASVSRDDGYSGELSGAAVSVGYPMMENTLTPTLLLNYAHYKLNNTSTKLYDALSTAVGAVYRPMPVLSFDAQIQYIANKVYQDDVRLSLRASYLFGQRLELF